VLFPELGRGVREEIVHAVPRHEIVVDALLLAAFAVGKIDDVYFGSAGFQEGLEPAQGMLHWGLHHDVGVEDYVHTPPVERDVFPLRQGCPSAMLIGPTPVPDYEQGRGAQPTGREGVTLLDSLGDPERDGRVAQLAAHGRMHVDRHARAAGRLVLDRLAVFDARLVGPVLVGCDLSRGRIDRDEKPRFVALTLGEPKHLQLALGLDLTVAAGLDHFRAYARLLKEHLLVLFC
jgi:hypothetical protein